MGNCHGKNKHKCIGSESYAACQKYQGNTSEDSELFEETCLSTEEVIEDVYNMIDTINQEIDMSTLANTCITFTEPKTVLSVISQMYTKLCALEDTIEIQAETILTMQGQIEDLQTITCP
jgi:hypothetical protein